MKILFVLDENLNLKFEKPSLPNLQTSDTYPKKENALSEYNLAPASAIIFGSRKR